MGKISFLYLQIYNEMKEKIESGEWKEGMKLPTEHELIDTFSVSRDTIRKALQKLTNDGYIYRQAGAGTFVKNIKSRYKLTVLESFSEQMISRDLAPSSEIIDISLGLPSQKIAKYLELKKHDKTYIVTRIRKADHEPMCYETAYVPEKNCPELDKKINQSTSLYKLYEDIYGLKIKYGDIFLEAEKCQVQIAEKLNIEKDSPMLKMNCIVYLENNKPLYFVETHYIGDKYVFFASMPRKL